MITNLNALGASVISNANAISTKVENNVESIGRSSFATQLENSKSTDTFSYVNDIKNCYPGTTVTVKSMTSSDVRKYYEEWKKQSSPCSGFKHDITVSPKVLEKMKNDPIYAEKMLAKIKKAATPEGFENATLYEYKVFVRDDGEIETMACADFMNGKKNTIDNNDEDKKKDEKKLELIYLHKKMQAQWELLHDNNDTIIQEQMLNKSGNIY